MIWKRVENELKMIWKWFENELKMSWKWVENELKMSWKWKFQWGDESSWEIRINAKVENEMFSFPVNDVIDCDHDDGNQGPDIDEINPKAVMKRRPVRQTDRHRGGNEFGHRSPRTEDHHGRNDVLDGTAGTKGRENHEN